MTTSYQVVRICKVAKGKTGFTSSQGSYHNAPDKGDEKQEPNKLYRENAVTSEVTKLAAVFLWVPEDLEKVSFCFYYLPPTLHRL
jgi:hypothetical protein